MTEFMEASEYLDSELQFESKMIWAIESIDSRPSNENEIDTRVFIYYDGVDDYFYAVGKRPDTKKYQYAPFHFKTQSVKGLTRFLFYTFGSELCNITLYNYNNIYSCETDTALLPYEFFETNMDFGYEVTGYDNSKLDIDMLKNMVKLLRDFD